MYFSRKVDLNLKGFFCTYVDISKTIKLGYMAVCLCNSWEHRNSVQKQPSEGSITEWKGASASKPSKSLILKF